jgi:hypothetical protein
MSPWEYYAAAATNEHLFPIPAYFSHPNPKLASKTSILIFESLQVT